MNPVARTSFPFHFRMSSGSFILSLYSKAPRLWSESGAPSGGLEQPAAIRTIQKRRFIDSLVIRRSPILSAGMPLAVYSLCDPEAAFLAAGFRHAAGCPGPAG